MERGEKCNHIKVKEAMRRGEEEKRKKARKVKIDWRRMMREKEKGSSNRRGEIHGEEICWEMSSEATENM